MEDFMNIDNLCELYPDDSEKLQNEIKSLKRKLEVDIDDDDKDGKVTKTDFTCELCNISFNCNSSLTKHVLSHTKPSFECELCGRRFRRKDFRDTHISRKHSQSGLGKKPNLPHSSSSQTSEQDSNVNTPHILADHSYASPVEQRVTSPPHTSTASADHSLLQRDQHSAIKEHSYSQKTALNASIIDHTIEPHTNEQYDMLTFFANTKLEVERFLKSRASQTGVKWYSSIQVELVKDDGDQQLVTKPHFRSKAYTTLNIQTFDDHDLNESFQKMFESFEKYIRESSGWVLKKVITLTIHTVLYKPLAGSSFMELPKRLRRMKSLLNIRNLDQKCFLWCCLASCHPSNSTLVSEYEPYENYLNMQGISYPVSINQINLFEKQNSLSVNVFSFEDGDVLPLRITKQTNSLRHIDLLLLQSETNSHYVLIKNLNTFLSNFRKGKYTSYFCHFCLHGFTQQSLLEDHIPYCQVHGGQKVELPTLKDRVLEFKDYEKTLRVPYVIYADFETLNKPLEQVSIGSTTKTHLLEPCSFAYKIVSTDPEYQKDTVVYRGPNASQHLLECLLQECDDIQDRLKVIKPLNLSPEEEESFQNADRCYLCQKLFEDSDIKSKHHDHTSGLFIGATHSNCNLNCKQATFIPVVFHNLKHFDAHILCQSIGTFKDHKIKCIAQTLEKYISFSIGKLRFIDSFGFLPCSLEQLVNDLSQDGLQSFTNFQNEIKEHTQLLLRKGVYPYEYMTDYNKFEETHLPSQEMFYSSLTKESISDELYNHAQTVYNTCKCQNMGDYHDLYLKTDVLLLADVFEQFRNTSYKCYNLDIMNYYTIPHYSFQAMLKHTQVSLELLSDVTMITFLEKFSRGGLSQISNRYAKANNPYLDEYDSTKETSYLAYFDVNNLYGFSMANDKLPCGSFYFLSPEEIDAFDIHQIPEDGDMGYILEVDLEYPSHLHDIHNDYPLAPERKFVSNESLSPYAQSMLKKLYKPKSTHQADMLPPRAKVEKLLATLENKDHYIIHYRNLKLYLQLGMQLKTIHKVLEFRQEAFMKSYIDFNTKRRQEAKTTFERNLMKLFNNSCFGKTMENVRKHRTVELCHTEDRLRKLSAKSSYKCHRIFSEDLVGVELTKLKVKLNKPIYIGTTILDLSKRLMYDFYYNHLKEEYGSDVRLQFTDTDSFLIHWKCEDIFQEMATYAELYDTSNFPKDHFLHSDVNKKVMGKMKSETGANCISEFCGLRSKMYAFKCGSEEDKRAKGIAKVVVKNELKFKHYIDTIINESQMKSEMSVLRSHDHQIYCEKITKTGLSCYDDKRYLLDDGISSLAYGHYKIKQ